MNSWIKVAIYPSTSGITQYSVARRLNSLQQKYINRSFHQNPNKLPKLMLVYFVSPAPFVRHRDLWNASCTVVIDNIDRICRLNNTAAGKQKERDNTGGKA